jgi:hypothetical protein
VLPGCYFHDLAIVGFALLLLASSCHGTGMARAWHMAPGTVRTWQAHGKDILHPDQPFAGMWLMEIWHCLV